MRLPCAPRIRQRQKGSLLIIVLWWLVILSIMSVGLYSTTRPRLEIAGRIQDNAMLRAASQAVFFTALLAVQEDDTPGFDSPAEAWANDEENLGTIELTSGTFAVGMPLTETFPGDGEPAVRFGLEDEESRLNVNEASLETLVRLFEYTCQLPAMECEALAGALIDWRDEDDDATESGAESVAYHDLANPYSPRNAPFQMPEELLLVKGVTPEIYRRIEPFITIFGAGAVNVNTASDTVLKIVGLGDTAVAALNRFRTGADGVLGTVDDVAFERRGDILAQLDDAGLLSNLSQSEIRRAINARMLTVRSDNFRGHVFQRLDNLPVKVQIIFVFNRSGAVRLWREL